MEWGSTPLRAEVPHLYRDAFVPQVLDVDIIGATGSGCYNSGSARASHGPHSGDARVMVILGQLQVEWVASIFKLFKYGVLTH